MELSEAIAHDLLQIKAIKLQPKNPFQWASGIKSPIYCDNRVALAYPEVRSKIIEGFCDKIEKIDGINLVAGVATAGIAHAALVADRLNMPMCYIRSKAKSHGRQNLIEGDLRNADKAIVIEDLFSTGGSSINAAKALAAEGIQIERILAIFSYGFENAKANFEEASFEYESISNLNILLKVAKQTNQLSNEEIVMVENWAKNFKK